MPIRDTDLADLSGSQTRESIEAMIEKWKPLLGLHNWKIKVIWDKPIKGKHNAEIVPSDKLRSAAIGLSRNFERWSDSWAETTIIHELLHCLHKPVDLVWEKTTGITDIPGYTPALHPEVSGVADDNYATETERFIDQLSCRLYDLHMEKK